MAFSMSKLSDFASTRSTTPPPIPESMALPTQWWDTSQGEDNAVLRYWDGYGWVRMDGKCESQSDVRCCDNQMKKQ